MELFVSDLTQCDQDRIALDSVKHEVGKKDITIGRQSGMIDSYKTQIKDLVNFNDSLSAQVVSLMLDKDSTQKKLKRSRNFWIMTATLSAATAIFVHYNWKNSYIEFDN